MEVLRIGLVLIIAGASTSDHNVTCTKTHPVVLGGNVNLTCALSGSDKTVTFQQTWIMTKGNKSKDVASYSEYGPRVKPEFDSYVSVFQLNSTEGSFIKSSLGIRKLEKEDEACYKCYFNIKHDAAAAGEICLEDIGGTSNELTCLALGTHIGIIMNPPEIMTRKSEQDMKGSGDGEEQPSGRIFDTNINASCTFFRKEAKTVREQKLKERSDEISLQCNVSVYGTEKLQIQWNNTGNAVANNTVTTNGNITTITSILPLPQSLLTYEQNISCNILPAAKGNLENLEEEKTIPEWGWILLAVVVVVLLCSAVFAIWKICSSSEQRKKDETSGDYTHSKNTEETPTKVFSEYKDETPTKESGGKQAEKNDWSKKGSFPRKLMFEEDQQ